MQLNTINKVVFSKLFLDNTSNTCDVKGSKQTKDVILFYFAIQFQHKPSSGFKRLQVYIGSFKYKQGHNNITQGHAYLWWARLIQCQANRFTRYGHVASLPGRPAMRPWRGWEVLALMSGHRSFSPCHQGTAMERHLWLTLSARGKRETLLYVCITVASCPLLWRSQYCRWEVLGGQYASTCVPEAPPLVSLRSQGLLSGSSPKQKQRKKGDWGGALNRSLWGVRLIQGPLSSPKRLRGVALTLVVPELLGLVSSEGKWLTPHYTIPNSL